MSPSTTTDPSSDAEQLANLAQRAIALERGPADLEEDASRQPARRHFEQHRRVAGRDRLPALDPVCPSPS